MVKTPSRRRKKEENGDETLQNEQDTPASRLRSRPKRRRENDEDEDDSSVTTNESSRRSSRRRSTRVRKNASEDEDSMTTDDNGDEPQRPATKKRKTSTKRAGRSKKSASKSDEESMTEDSIMASEDDDDSSMDAKPSAVSQNGHGKPAAAPSLPPVPEEEEEEEDAHATNGGGAKKAATLPPISKLRMPSKHTPGKLQTTAPRQEASSRSNNAARLEFGVPTTHLLTQVPPTAAGFQQQQQQEPQVSPPGVDNVQLNAILVQGNTEEQPPTLQVQQQQVSWFQVATTSLGTVVYSMGDFVTSLVVPQVEQYADGEEEEEFVEVPTSSPLLTRPLVWFLLLLLLQVACWNPLVTTVQDTTDRSLDFYKSLLGKTTDSSTLEETKTVVIDKTMDNETQQELQDVSQVLETFRKDSHIHEELQFAQRKLLEIRGRLRERQQALDDWQSGLVDVESALTGLGTAESMDDVPRLFFRANEILGFFKDMVPPTLSTELLDTTYVFLWETASASNQCNLPQSEDSTLDDAIMTLDKLQMVQEELRQMSQSSVAEIQSNEQVLNSLRLWVRDALPKNVTSPSSETSTTTTTHGLTQTMVNAVIAEVLQELQADQLGVVDYASIAAGASVIGRATSPSLIDSLPLWNRLMETARLRFYGYGPEAALTPTFPMNALGQCWAFESDSGRMGGGKYATLTVEMKKPIYVTNVAIEHAARELTDQLETAIRSFRIIGYKDGDAAMKDPLHLGSFGYDIDAPRTLQIFQVANHANGELIPKLRFVTLAIDSNWGSAYSCLYRFRVLGGDVPSEDVVEAALEEVKDYAYDSEDHVEDEIIEDDIIDEVEDVEHDDQDTMPGNPEVEHGADSTLEDEFEDESAEMLDEESQDTDGTEQDHEEMNGSDQHEAYEQETDDSHSDPQLDHNEYDQDEEEEVHRWDAGEDGNVNDHHEDGDSGDSGDEDRYEDDSGDSGDHESYEVDSGDHDSGDDSDDADDESHHDNISYEEERHRDYPRHHDAQQSSD